MKRMYDSVSALAIPSDAEVVAGYVDGRYVWSPADWARFPNAIKVRIAVFAWTNDGHVLDVEPGNASPAECPGWIKMRQAAGIEVPTIYCGGYNLSAVRDACKGLTYDIWFADPTGTEHLVGGTAATQYGWTNTGGNYDLSVCADFWPRVPVAEPDPLIGALAYVTDDLGDRLLAVQAELQRVRAQFIGPRP